MRALPINAPTAGQRLLLSSLRESIDILYRRLALRVQIRFRTMDSRKQRGYRCAL